MIEWTRLPEKMQTDEVKKYYEILKHKSANMLVKRCFDVLVSVILLIVLLPFFLVISVCIKCTSPGPIFFRQVRVTKYNKKFKIFKFRTMVDGADKIGSQVTTEQDSRVTSVGKFLRKIRLDEIPQLINILIGDMTFVGTRPEVPKYVDQYTPEMMATLLLPAGVTSLASISFKDEEKLLKDVDSVDEVYMNEVLPQKMKFNLEYITKFSFVYDIKLMVKTVVAVLK